MEVMIKQSDCGKAFSTSVLFDSEFSAASTLQGGMVICLTRSSSGVSHPTVSTNRIPIVLVAFCNKQLCKNVVSSPQVLVRKIKTNKNEVMCCVVFRGPVLYIPGVADSNHL